MLRQFLFFLSCFLCFVLFYQLCQQQRVGYVHFYSACSMNTTVLRLIILKKSRCLKRNAMLQACQTNTLLSILLWFCFFALCGALTDTSRSYTHTCEIILNNFNILERVIFIACPAFVVFIVVTFASSHTNTYTYEYRHSTSLDLTVPGLSMEISHREILPTMNQEKKVKKEHF